MPELEIVNAKRDFKTVTKTGNELIKTIQATAEAEDHGQIIKDGLESAIREYISIILERSDTTNKVGQDGRYDFLIKLDIQSIFEEKVMAEAVASNKLQHLVEQLAKDQKNVLKKIEVMDRLDQVGTFRS